MNENTDNKKLHPVLPRLFAFLIDLIILGISCFFLIQLIVSHTNLNPISIHSIGTMYCLIYFAMLNSHVSLGKTIGKMICRIRVADFQGQSINASQSFIRSSIFILPLCIAGYLETLARFSLTWTIVQSLCLSVVFACIYLVISNTHSQQGLHDLLTRTQVLRNFQTIIERKTIWKGHIYIIAIISGFIIFYSAWNFTTHEQNDFSDIDASVQNITLNSHQTFIGEAISLDTTLIFDVNYLDRQDQTNNARNLVSKFNKENPNFITQQGVNKAQINHSIQFGLFKFEKIYVYHVVENYGVITLLYSGEAQTIKFV